MQDHRRRSYGVALPLHENQCRPEEAQARAPREPIDEGSMLFAGRAQRSTKDDRAVAKRIALPALPSELSTRASAHLKKCIGPSSAGFRFATARASSG